jgi:hypothetical protein
VMECSLPGLPHLCLSPDLVALLPPPSVGERRVNNPAASDVMWDVDTGSTTRECQAISSASARCIRGVLCTASAVMCDVRGRVCHSPGGKLVMHQRGCPAW